MSDQRQEKLVFNETELAQALNVSVRTIRRWRSEGTGPPFAKLNDAPQSPVRYRLSDVDEWLTSRLRGGDSD